MERIQGHRVLEIGSEWDLLALYIVRHAPTLQIDNRNTLEEPKSASDRGGARDLLTASACTSSTIKRCFMPPKLAVWVKEERKYKTMGKDIQYIQT